MCQRLILTPQFGKTDYLMLQSSTHCCWRAWWTQPTRLQYSGCWAMATATVPVVLALVEGVAATVLEVGIVAGPSIAVVVRQELCHRGLSSISSLMMACIRTRPK